MIEAVEQDGEDGEDPADADGDAGEPPGRRRITRSRPRPARRETAGSGPARLD